VIEPEHARVIDQHKRILDRAKKATPTPLESDLITGPLKLTRNVMFFLKQQAIKEFNRQTAPSSEEARCIASGIAARELLVFEHARTYAKAIDWAVGEFADLLT
jgi:hypothetical protein